jgi:hypothetical protein
MLSQPVMANPGIADLCENEGLILGHGPVIEVGSENFIARRPQVLNEQKQKRLLRPPGVYTWRQG